MIPMQTDVIELRWTDIDQEAFPEEYNDKVNWIQDEGKRLGFDVWVYFDMCTREHVCSILGPPPVIQQFRLEAAKKEALT